MSDGDYLDGCELDFTDDTQLTDEEDIDALVLFADVWDVPEAVEVRRIELIELDLALRDV